MAGEETGTWLEVNTPGRQRRSESTQGVEGVRGEGRGNGTGKWMAHTVTFLQIKINLRKQITGCYT